jgi:hypothetical protein
MSTRNKNKHTIAKVTVLPNYDLQIYYQQGGYFLIDVSDNSDLDWCLHDTFGRQYKPHSEAAIRLKIEEAASIIVANDFEVDYPCIEAASSVIDRVIQSMRDGTYIPRQERKSGKSKASSNKIKKLVRLQYNWGVKGELIHIEEATLTDYILELDSPDLGIRRIKLHKAEVTPLIELLMELS